MSKVEHYLTTKAKLSLHYNLIYPYLTYSSIHFLLPSLCIATTASLSPLLQDLYSKINEIHKYTTNRQIHK